MYSGLTCTPSPPYMVPQNNILSYGIFVLFQDMDFALAKAIAK